MARQIRPTQGRIAHATAQGMEDARAFEGILKRAQDGVPAEEDRPMLIAIARRMPAPVKAQLAPVLATLGVSI